MIQSSEAISLTNDLKKVIKIAQAIAKENMHAEFSSPHLLKALLHKEAGLHPLLKRLNKEIFYLEEWAEVRIESLEKSSKFPDFIQGDSIISEVINEAENIRIKLLRDSIEPLHVLAALSTPGVGF